ncbi:MAG: DUF1573 domain-containing protein [Gemmataceae bacterium]
MTRFAMTVVLLGAIVTASALAQSPNWADKMFKDGVSKDFGNQPHGALLTHTFTVTNIYAVQMEITQIKSGCGCVTATAKKRVLAPRETTAIDVVMDTKRFTGPKTVGVRVTVGPEYISSTELVVKANSRADIVFNPGQVNFGAVTRGQTPAQFIDVEYAGTQNWQVTEVVAKDVPFTVSHKESYRRPGGVGYRLTVTLKADAPVGTHRHNVFLKTNDAGSPLVAVLVEAAVQSPLTVSPEALSLGAVKVGTPLIRRVVVRGSKPFQVTGVEGVGDGFDLAEPLAVNEQPVHFVTFRCQPGKDGAFRREMKIKTTLQDTPVSVIIDGLATK